MTDGSPVPKIGGVLLAQPPFEPLAELPAAEQEGERRHRRRR